MNDKSKATILIMFAMIFFALMGMSVKLTEGIPVSQKIFFRNLITILVILSLCKKNKVNPFGKKQNLKFLLLRSFMGLIGVGCFFFAISKLSLSDSAMLNKTSPFFVILFSATFLKEKITKYHIFAVILAFSGALFIIKPEFNLAFIPALIGFLSAIFAGAAYTLVRYLKSFEKPETIIFYFAFISILATIPFIFIDFVVPGFTNLIYLLLIGIFAAFGQYFLTLAYRFAPASEISIFQYTHVIFAGIIGFFIWKDIPDTYSIFGSILIISAAIIIFLKGRNRKIR